MIFDDFMIRSIFATLGVALCAAPIGCFVIWRRMAYFGDATSHAAILGVAFAFILNLPILLGVVVVCAIVAFLIYSLQSDQQSSDSLLGVIGYSGLALGIVFTSLFAQQQLSFESLLFGDILAISKLDLAMIWAGAAALLIMLWVRWNKMISATVSPDLSTAAGISVRREELIFILSLAFVVALTLKVIGALLIGAMLIIPAATARRVSKSPEMMAVMATLIAAFSGLVGIWFSFSFDTPTGPSIVSVLAATFFLSQFTIRR